MAKPTTTNFSFTAYQKFAIFILAITQFTVYSIIMSPLGDILMKMFEIKPAQFVWLYQPMHSVPVFRGC
jgi:hypothetical protein